MTHETRHHVCAKIASSQIKLFHTRPKLSQTIGYVSGYATHKTIQMKIANIGSVGCNAQQVAFIYRIAVPTEEKLFVVVLSSKIAYKQGRHLKTEKRHQTIPTFAHWSKLKKKNISNVGVRHIHSKYQLTKIYWLLTLTKRQELGGRLEMIENQMHRIVVQAIDEVDTVHGDEDRLE